MDAHYLASRIQHLPVAAQRLVAELIELLSQNPAVGPQADWLATEAPGATMLPPLDLTGSSTSWPENEFANPEFYGAWADRTDITDSTEYVRQLRREHWGAN